MDPGFVPTNVPEYHHAVKQVSHSSITGEFCHAGLSSLFGSHIFMRNAGNNDVSGNLV